jgi:hypothetical protein
LQINGENKMSMYSMYPDAENWPQASVDEAKERSAAFYGGLGHASDYGVVFDDRSLEERTKVESSHRPLSHDLAQRVVEQVVPAPEM